MAKYYRYDVARWEGEGGAPAAIPESWSATQSMDVRDWKTVAWWRIAGSIAILAGSVLYARRKRWI